MAEPHQWRAGGGGVAGGRLADRPDGPGVDVGSWQELAPRLALRFGGGVAAGALVGWLLAELLQLQLTLGCLFLLSAVARRCCRNRACPRR